jgi:hypothetical protein
LIEVYHHLPIDAYLPGHDHAPGASNRFLDQSAFGQQNIDANLLHDLPLLSCATALSRKQVQHGPM